MNQDLIDNVMDHLASHDAHKHLKQLNSRQVFNDGKSGAAVYLLQARYRDEERVRTQLLIAKLFANDERGARDADHEQEGYKLLSESWPSDRLTEHPLRLEINNQIIIIFSFADKTSLGVHSAKNLIESDNLGRALELVVKHYRELTPSLTEPTQLDSFGAYLRYCLDEQLAHRDDRQGQGHAVWLLPRTVPPIGGCAWGRPERDAVG